jgi:SAM-dependent methyltransferase
MEELFWNQRYSDPEFAYGRQPNLYFKQYIDRLKPGKLLLPGEGEGRNAVYAAGLGWIVDAVDQSEAGKKKADSLAGEAGVSVNYKVENLEEFDFGNSVYDLVALIFVHFPSELRISMHQKLIRSIKPGGYILIEAFSKSQLGRSSGGPQNTDVLNSKEEFLNDFNTLDIIELFELETVLDEGSFHQGIASVLRMIARK